MRDWKKPDKTTIETAKVGAPRREVEARKHSVEALRCEVGVPRCEVGALRCEVGAGLLSEWKQPDEFLRKTDDSPINVPNRAGGGAQTPRNCNEIVTAIGALLPGHTLKPCASLEPVLQS